MANRLRGGVNAIYFLLIIGVKELDEAVPELPFLFFLRLHKVISLEWQQWKQPCRTAAYKANSVGGKEGTSEATSAMGDVVLQELC